MKKFRDVKILTAKKWKNHYSIQIVFEWDDIISQHLGFELDVESQPIIAKRYTSRFSQLLQKLIRHTFLKNYIDSSFNYLLRKKRGVLFINHQLYVIDLPNLYVYQYNSIPIFIDCFRDMVNKIPELCKKNPMFFVTDYEVYLKLKQSSVANKVHFVPLSISDKYYNRSTPQKSIDVLQIGRQNPVLHQWMMQVCEKYPHIEYVYAVLENNMLSYYSTTRGLISDSTDSRDDFMRFLGKAKISLLSSPGMDGGDIARTGGFNPVTPRFYESAVNHCYMIGRYPDTPDFIYNKVADVCARPETYDAFENAVLDRLSKPFVLDTVYNDYIKMHLTSNVAAIIGEKIKPFLL